MSFTGCCNWWFCMLGLFCRLSHSQTIINKIRFDNLTDYVVLDSIQNKNFSGDGGCNIMNWKNPANSTQFGIFYTVDEYNNIYNPSTLSQINNNTKVNLPFTMFPSLNVSISKHYNSFEQADYPFICQARSPNIRNLFSCALIGDIPPCTLYCSIYFDNKNAWSDVILISNDTIPDGWPGSINILCLDDVFFVSYNKQYGEDIPPSLFEWYYSLFDAKSGELIKHNMLYQQVHDIIILQTIFYLPSSESNNININNYGYNNSQLFIFGYATYENESNTNVFDHNRCVRLYHAQYDSYNLSIQFASNYSQKICDFISDPSNYAYYGQVVWQNMFSINEFILLPIMNTINGQDGYPFHIDNNILDANLTILHTFVLEFANMPNYFVLTMDKGTELEMDYLGVMSHSIYYAMDHNGIGIVLLDVYYVNNDTMECVSSNQVYQYAVGYAAAAFDYVCAGNVKSTSGENKWMLSWCRHSFPIDIDGKNDSKSDTDDMYNRTIFGQLFNVSYVHI